MNENFEQFMENNQPALTESEQAQMFLRINEGLKKPVASPYYPVIFSRPLVVGSLALFVLLATTGTVLASEASRPGDLLFPVDRAREEAQLLLSGDQNQTILKERFAEERLSELKEILLEEQFIGQNEMSPRTAEAFTVVEEYLRTLDNEESRERLFHALENHRRGSDAEEKSGEGEEGGEFNIEDDKVELRDGQHRIEIKDDGERRIRIEDEASKFEYREDKDVSPEGEMPSVKKFEVRVEDNKTEVRLEYGGVKDEYETSYSTEEDIIVEAAARSGLPIEVLLMSLDIEYKD
jgi:Domain of unknown function (DUF5667)